MNLDNQFFSSKLSSNDSNRVIVKDNVISVKSDMTQRVRLIKDEGWSESLGEIVNKLKDVELNSIKSSKNIDGVTNLSVNYKWLNHKIENHNKRIDENFFTRTLDNILHFLVGEKHQLKYATLDPEIKLLDDEIKLFNEEQLKGLTVLSEAAESPEFNMTEEQQGHLIKYLQNLELQGNNKLPHVDFLKVWSKVPIEFKKDKTIQSNFEKFSETEKDKAISQRLKYIKNQKLIDQQPKEIQVLFRDAYNPEFKITEEQQGYLIKYLQSIELQGNKNLQVPYFLELWIKLPSELREDKTIQLNFMKFSEKARNKATFKLPESIEKQKIIAMEQLKGLQVLSEGANNPDFKITKEQQGRLIKYLQNLELQENNKLRDDDFLKMWVKLPKELREDETIQSNFMKFSETERDEATFKLPENIEKQKIFDEEQSKGLQVMSFGANNPEFKITKEQQGHLIKYLQNLELPKEKRLPDGDFLKMWSRLPNELRKDETIQSNFMKFPERERYKAVSRLPENFEKQKIIDEEETKGLQVLSQGANNPEFKISKEQQGHLIKYLQNLELQGTNVLPDGDFLKMWSKLPKELREDKTIQLNFLKFSKGMRNEAFLLLPENIIKQKLLSDYATKSYVEEMKLTGLNLEEIKEKITPDQEKDLTVLISGRNAPTIHELQNNPSLRAFVKEKAAKELQSHLAVINPENADHSLLQAISTLDRLENVISHENLLQTLIFVRDNRDLMDITGVESANRQGIRKFKAAQYHIPHDIQYDTKSGEIFVKLGFLGEGAFKTVKQHLTLTSPDLPMHAVAKQKRTLLTSREVDMMFKANGLPHVISVHKVIDYTKLRKNQNKQAIISPVYNMGGLKAHMESSSVGQKEKLQITAEILKGVMGLHERGIIHRDIKPANIFLDKSIENGKSEIHAFVGDLGLACLKEGDPSRQESVGSPFYMHPNIIQQKAPADENSDAWATGVLLMDLFKGQTPFDSAKYSREVAEIGRLLGNPALNPPPEDVNSLDYVIWGLLQPDPDKQMSLKDALANIERLIATT